MSCKNCFNGCTEIVSDKCVKYTGVDIPALGISNGDTLLSVESAITTFLVPMLTGGGIMPTIPSQIICDTVSKYLPNCTECTGFTLNEILIAIIKASCDLQNQITDVALAIETLNQDYTLGCINTVSPSSGTHSVLQAVINKLCLVDSSLTGLANSLPTTYVSIANIDSYIEAYLANSGSTTLVSSKMVPYVAMEYYGPLTQFDVTGAGTGEWTRVFLCNGNNGTPDKRGRVAVGTTTGMGGGAFSAAVDPNIPGNPSYSLLTAIGTNSVVLAEGNLPPHNHIVTIASAGAHTHYTAVSATQTINNDNSLYDGTNTVRFEQGLSSKAYDQGPENAFDYELTTSPGTINAGLTSSNGAHTHTNTVSNTGGGTGHTNIQPVLACHYIIYIP